jgi:hypothetical protein
VPVRVEHLLSNQFDTTSESASGSHDFNGVTPTRITLYVVVDDVQGNTTESGVLTVEVSPDRGSTLVTYDKLITDAGTDGPVASVTYALNAAADDIISLAKEDVVDHITVTVAANGSGGTPLDSSNRADVNIWLVWTY